MGKDADELRYQMVAETYERELDRAERLDSKISNMVGISGTLMTLFLGLGTFMLEKIVKENPYLNALRVSLVLGLTLFTTDIVILVMAYRLRKYRFDPHPKQLIEKYGNMGHTELTLLVTSNIADSTMANRGLNDAKARTLARGFHFLWIAIFAVLLYGILLVEALSLQ